MGTLKSGDKNYKEKILERRNNIGLTRADLTDPRISDKDKAEIKIAIDNYLKNESWVKKTFLPMAILLTGHPGGRAYMKASIESHKKLGYWLVLTYDNYINPEVNHLDYNSIMPAKDVMDMVDTFVIPHHQTWGGVSFPYFWQLKFGASILQDFEYIYCSNADCVIEKPEGFSELFKLLDDADFMSIGPVTESSVNTTAFIARTKAFKDIMNHFGRHFIPFENYEKYTQDFGNTEGRFYRAIKDLGLKQVIVKAPLNEQIPAPGQGSWYELLGFRHIHFEHNYAYRYKGIPPHYKYLDERFMGDEYRQIKQYWQTQDNSILEQWWAKA